MAETATISGAEIERLAREAESWSAQDVLRWTLKTFGNRIALSTSFQAEGMVLLDMAHKINPNVRVFTIDTGRLPQETYELIERVRERYQISIEVYYPNADELSQMVTKHGLNLFYRSVSLRVLCCELRKVKPMQRALTKYDAWITGLRRGQSDTRKAIAKIELDQTHQGKVKVNALADWTEKQVWDYIRDNDVPYNELYDKGYTSIGCAPCTRAIQPGEDPRAGRWWWEKGIPKECGIHMSPVKR